MPDVWLIRNRNTGKRNVGKSFDVTSKCLGTLPPTKYRRKRFRVFVPRPVPDIF